MGKTSATEILMNELMIRGVDHAKAKFLIDECKKEWREKNRRKSYLFANSSQQQPQSARDFQNAALAQYRSAIDALFGQDQSQNGSTLGFPARQLLPAPTASGDHAGGSAGYYADPVPVPRRDDQGDCEPGLGHADSIQISAKPKRNKRLL